MSFTALRLYGFTVCMVDTGRLPHSKDSGADRSPNPSAVSRETPRASRNATARRERAALSRAAIQTGPTSHTIGVCSARPEQRSATPPHCNTVDTRLSSRSPRAHSQSMRYIPRIIQSTRTCRHVAKNHLSAIPRPMFARALEAHAAPGSGLSLHAQKVRGVQKPGCSDASKHVRLQSQYSS